MQRTDSSWSAVSQALPALLVVGGVFLSVVGGLAGLVYYLNSRPTVNNLVKAENASTTVLSYLPAGDVLSAKTGATPTYTLTLALTTGSQTIDGLQLDILVKGNVTNLVAKPIVASGLVLVKNTTTAVAGGFQTKLLLLPVTAGQPVQLADQKGVVELELQAQPNTSLIVEVKSGTSLATLFRQPSTQVLTIPSPVSYQLRDSTPPTPGVNPTFQLNFAQQGLSSSGVILATELVLKNTNSTLQRFNVTAKSGPNGILSLVAPLNLSSNDLGKTYQVFVKTPTSLMKKLGTVSVATGLNSTPANWSQNPLIVGDLENSGAEANVISIADIAKMLSVYTQLRTPVSGQTTQYDVNFDGSIDIADVALVLSNFTALQVVGDTP